VSKRSVPGLEAKPVGNVARESFSWLVEHEVTGAASRHDAVAAATSLPAREARNILTET
jgi:hypothetical protein